MWKIAITMMVMAGCDSPGDMTEKPNQARAIDIVWHQIYGQRDDAPPVEWHHGTYLWGSTAGFTFAGWKICVADKNQPLEWFYFSSTSMAHELLHERTFERTGDVDAFHIRGDWNLENDAVNALGSSGP